MLDKLSKAFQVSMLIAYQTSVSNENLNIIFTHMTLRYLRNNFTIVYYIDRTNHYTLASVINYKNYIGDDGRCHELDNIQLHYLIDVEYVYINGIHHRIN